MHLKVIPKVINAFIYWRNALKCFAIENIILQSWFISKVSWKIGSRYEHMILSKQYHPGTFLHLTYFYCHYASILKADQYWLPDLYQATKARYILKSALFLGVLVFKIIPRHWGLLGYTIKCLSVGTKYTGGCVVLIGNLNMDDHYLTL